MSSAPGRLRCCALMSHSHTVSHYCPICRIAANNNCFVRYTSPSLCHSLCLRWFAIIKLEQNNIATNNQHRSSRNSRRVDARRCRLLMMRCHGASGADMANSHRCFFKHPSFAYISFNSCLWVIHAKASTNNNAWKLEFVSKVLSFKTVFVFESRYHQFFRRLWYRSLTREILGSWVSRAVALSVWVYV